MIRLASPPVRAADFDRMRELRTADLTVRLLPATEVTAAAAVWRELEARVGGGGLACAWDWTETWLNHYGDCVPHWFAVGERAGVVHGIALLTEGRDGWRRGPVGIHRLHLGTAGEPRADTVYVEYNRLLVAPEERDAFAAALVATIRRQATWDEFVLDGFAAEDAAALLGAEPALSARRVPCPTFDLGAARDAGADVLDLLKASSRQRIRRSLRGFGPIETEWAETPEQALDILDELTALHQRRWQEDGKPGVFASARFTGFHRELISRLLPKGAVVLFRARTAADTLGCLYSFVERNNVLFYQSGLAAFDDNKLKPGLVLHALCMQGCLERGFDDYNFLADDSRYKQELSTVERELIWATARRPGPKLRVLDGARTVRRWMG